MALILKKPTDKAKGIAVFTHKEWPWLLKNQLPFLEELDKSFLLGWNQGTFIEAMTLPPIIKFAFTSNNMIGTYNDNGVTEIFPYCDRNFLLKEFKNLRIQEKYFDFICVSRAIKWKMVPSLLEAFRQILDTGRKFKALLVIPKAQNEDSNGADDIVNLYQNLFNHEERKDIVLNRLSSELGFMGMSPKMINFLYNNSKVSYIGSKSEGTCRAVHEALLGGCKIVYYKNHKGGLVDYLNDENSVSYEDHSKLTDSLIKALDSYDHDTEKIDYYDYLLSERHTIGKLKKVFEPLYKKYGMEFDGEFINHDNLSNRLPAHYLDVPWFKDGNGITADIENDKQLESFINYINEICSK